MKPTRAFIYGALVLTVVAIAWAAWNLTFVTGIDELNEPFLKHANAVDQGLESYRLLVILAADGNKGHAISQVDTYAIERWGTEHPREALKYPGWKFDADRVRYSLSQGVNFWVAHHALGKCMDKLRSGDPFLRYSDANPGKYGPLLTPIDLEFEIALTSATADGIIPMGPCCACGCKLSKTR